LLCRQRSTRPVLELKQNTSFFDQSKATLCEMRTNEKFGALTEYSITYPTKTYGGYVDTLAILSGLCDQAPEGQRHTSMENEHPSPRARDMRSILRWALVVMMVVAGLMHFARPEFYLRIMPSFLPRECDRPLVLLTGVLEIVLAVLLAFPRT